MAPGQKSSLEDASALVATAPSLGQLRPPLGMRFGPWDGVQGPPYLSGHYISSGLMKGISVIFLPRISLDKVF